MSGGGDRLGHPQSAMAIARPDTVAMKPVSEDVDHFRFKTALVGLEKSQF
jgi:hypothetical protein